VIAHAKDPDPVKRVSLRRLQKMAKQAFIEIKKIDGKIHACMSDLKRKFKNLREAWEFFIQEDWALHDLFPDLPGHTPPEPPTRTNPKKQAECKFCGKAIEWVKNLFSGKFQPFEPSGGRHICAEYYQHKGKPIPF
jgi:hypothetical protein